MENRETHPLPSIAELRAMSAAELAERHDELVYRSRETHEPVSDIYAGELARRIALLQAERTLRIALAAFFASAAAVVITLLVFLLAL